VQWVGVRGGRSEIATWWLDGGRVYVGESSIQ
jgi:hypothetical protein